MQESLAEMQEAANEGFATPEMLDNVKAMVKPLMDNYMTLSYVKYLLDIPAKKQKLPRYKEMNRKFLKNIPHEYTDIGHYQANGKVLSDLRKESKTITKV